jgi:UDPglucose 6-dehydrogenase
MIKYAANAFLALKVSFINEIAGFCERVGADVREVARGIGYDSRIGHAFLGAGIGWGGSCFGKDVRALIAAGLDRDYRMPILEAALEVNRRQREEWVVGKLKEILGDLRGRVVGVWGLAFKPGTDDLRDAPSLDIIRKLVNAGSIVRAYDPAAISRLQDTVSGAAVVCVADPYRAAEGADAVVLVTEWEEFAWVDWNRIKELMRVPFVVDGRNFLDGTRLEALGFVYRGVGIPS